MKYQKILLQIIEEEIDRYLLEQAPPPPAPAPPATPPADPSAPADPNASPPAEEEEETSDDEDDGKIEKTIKSLAAKTPIDIKKTILSALQNGAEKADTEALVAYVKKKEEPEEDSESSADLDTTEEKVPENIKKAVKHIIKTFKFKVPEKAEKKAEEQEEKEDEGDEAEEKPAAPSPAAAAPAAPPSPPPAAPVKESRLQTSLREYLMYKQLSQKVRS